MKDTFKFAVLVAISIIVHSYYTTSNNFEHNKELFPPIDPTYIHSKNKSSEKELQEMEEKSEANNSMHSSKVGVNWRRKDQEYRINKNRSSANNLVKGNWVEKGANNQAGRIVYAIYDSIKNEIKAASASGIIWSSELESGKWKALNDQYRIDGIISMGEIFKDTSKRLVVASSFGSVFFSNDNAKSWNESQGLGPINTNGTIRKMVTCADSSFLVFGEEWDPVSRKTIFVLYFSKDGAKTFSKIKTYNQALYGKVINFDLHSISNSDSVAYFYYRDSVAEINGTTGKFNYAYRAYPAIWGEVMLTGGRQGDSLKLFANVRELIYSSNGDLSNWTYRGKLTEKAFASNSMSYSSLDTATIVYGGVELFASRNGGNKWAKINDWKSYYKNPKNSLHADIPFVGRFEKSNKQEFHLIGTDGGLYVSYDQIKSVKNLSLNKHLNAQYYSVYTEKINEDFIFLGSQDQGLQRTRNDTLKKPLDFTQIASGDFGHLCSGDSGKTLWFTNPNFAGFYENPKTDTTITTIWDFNDTFNVSLWLPPITADPSNNKKAYLIGVHRKNDLDKKSNIVEMELIGTSLTWKTRDFNFNIDNKKEEFLTALSISPLDELIWYAITNKGNFYYSFDRGIKWNRSSFFQGPGTHNLYGSGIYASHSNKNHVYVSGSGYSNPPVFKSSNNGRDWDEFSDSLPGTLAYKITGNSSDSLLFAATEVGPFVYNKNIGYWAPLSGENGNVSPDQIYWDVEFLPQSNVARFATFGRGIWDFEIILEEDTLATRELLSKKQQISLYPNPCTTHLHVAGGNKENFKIFSIHGILVMNGSTENRTIELKDLQAGGYIIVFEKENEEPIVKRFVKIAN